jgi:tetratricopeptide (TPR) repeat protein
MLKRIFITLAAVFALIPSDLALAATPAQATTTERIIVLPFENTSNLKEYNWVGESFADSLAELLNVPGLAVVSGDERGIVYQRLRLPETVIPSRATAIKIGREAQATLVVLGTYEVVPARDEKSVASVRGSARIVRVNEGRLTGAVMPDGRWATHVYDFSDALTNLQTMQGKIAYQILYERDRALAVAQNEILSKAAKIPPRAFEAYVKGKMTDDRDAEKKSIYLRNAMTEYAKANAGSTYAQAAFELAQLYFSQGDFTKAAEHFSMLQSRDPHYAEAAFYAAISYSRMNDTARALGALIPLAKEAPLTSIYNNTGALSAEAARAEKAAEERERLLKQAVNFLGRAAETTPNDPYVNFNNAFVLMMSGKYAEAAAPLRAVIKDNPKDPEALFLFAKVLEKTGQAEAAEVNDNEARKYFGNYGKAQVEWQKSQTVASLPVRLRLKQNFNRQDYFAELLAQTERVVREGGDDSTAQGLLSKARDHYAAGRDDEALAELRRVVIIEPMNAEAYLLTGRIFQRRGDLEPAINQLKTAIFWDNERKLIDAYVLLGRIFLERGDRAMAMSYARSALQIDPNNQEAVALHRQVELGSR